MECNNAEIVDLGFIQDLDQVKAVTKSDEKVVDETPVKPVNPRDEWITLNVGGTRYLTCRSTLAMNAAQTGMLVRNKDSKKHFKNQSLALNKFKALFQ